MDLNGTLEFTHLLTPILIWTSYEETAQNTLTMLPNTMGMFWQEVATLHFSNGYHQNHLTASFNLNQLEPFTKTKLILNRGCSIEENTQMVQALLLIE
jgi:hypothetical protein